MAKVNIIMRCFNRLEYTMLTIRNIDLLAGYDDYKIIAIDNNSSDGTWDWLQSIKKEGYYKIHPIHTEENLGDFGGTKLGYQNLDDDCIYTMQWDNDCPPISHNFLKHMVGIMDLHEDIGQLMLKRNGVGGVIPITNKQEFLNVVFGDAPMVTCVNMHRREVVDNLNYWVVDESEFWDFQLNKRMLAAGYKLKKIENLRVLHIDNYKEEHMKKYNQGERYPLYFGSRKDRQIYKGVKKVNYNVLNYKEIDD